MADSITIRQPDDWHIHLRDGELMHHVLPFTSKVFGRALVMPNLAPPVVSGRGAESYGQRIMASLADGDLKKLWSEQRFIPLMTIKLIGSTTPDTILSARSSGVVAAKLYPEGVTTNSSDGISEFTCDALHKVFDAMADCGMVLCVHAESPSTPSLRRESHFVGRYVIEWAKRHPSLKIVIEHASDAFSVKVARDWANVACSITVHHLLLTLDDVIGDKLNPHNFCKPIAKSEGDRQALIEAAIGGSPDFFFGSDSAPHVIGAKHAAHGMAGCFTAPVAMPLLAQIFDEHGALACLEMFASENGANFYGMPLNEGEIRLVKKEGFVPHRYDWDDDGIHLIPFWAGRNLQWKVTEAFHEKREDSAQE